MMPKFIQGFFFFPSVMDSFIMGGMYLTHAGRYLGTYLLTTMTPLGLVPYLFLKYRMQPAYIGRYLLQELAGWPLLLPSVIVWLPTIGWTRYLVDLRMTGMTISHWTNHQDRSVHLCGVCPLTGINRDQYVTDKYSPHAADGDPSTGSDTWPL